MYLDRAQLRLNDSERDAFLTAHRWGRLSTVNKQGEPHVAPLGYVYRHEKAYFHALVKSRRGRDLAGGSLACLCVDDGVAAGQGYASRVGVILYGHVAVITAETHPELTRDVRNFFAEVFFGDPTMRFERRTHAWYELTPYRSTSWDFSRIPEGSDRAVSLEDPPIARADGQ